MRFLCPNPSPEGEGLKGRNKPELVYTNPKFFVAKLPILGITVGKSVADTPNQLAIVAAY